MRWCHATELDGILLLECSWRLAYARCYAKSNMSRLDAYSYTDGITHSNTYTDGITQRNAYTGLYGDESKLWYHFLQPAD